MQKAVQQMAVKMIQLASREEWLAHRMNYIGGSEISAIIGRNPFMDNVTLWEYKTGRRQAKDISDNEAVKYGTQAEMHLRGLFRLDFPKYRVEYVENNSFLNDAYPWAAASCDGWLTDKEGRRGVLEIKTARIRQASQWALWDKQVPPNYYCQCLMYMAVVEADFCILKAQLKTDHYGVPNLKTRHYTIERADVQADIDYLMAKGAEFWEYVKRDERPPLVLPTI